MSQQITITLKIPGDKEKNITGPQHSMTIDQNATLRDLLKQDFKRDKWIKSTGERAYKDCVGFIFVFDHKEIGSYFLDETLNELKIKNDSVLYVVFAMCNNRSNIIKFSDSEEDSKNKVSNKCRSKLRIALAVIDILLLIAFILTICFDVATFIPAILFVAFFILAAVVVNWNDIVPKNYKDIPCGFFSCCSKSENQYFKYKEDMQRKLEDDYDNQNKIGRDDAL